MRADYAFRRCIRVLYLPNELSRLSESADATEPPLRIRERVRARLVHSWYHSAGGELGHSNKCMAYAYPLRSCHHLPEASSA